MIYWFVLLLTCCYCTATFTFDDRNLKLCDSDTDPIIHSKKYSKKYGSEPGLIVKEDVYINKPGKTITCIHVIELYRDGTGGYALLSAGGLGHSYAIITLRSEILRSYSFRVKVRGKPTPPPSQGQPTATPSLFRPANVGLPAKPRTKTGRRFRLNGRARMNRTTTTPSPWGPANVGPPAEPRTTTGHGYYFKNHPVYILDIKRR